MAKINSEVSEVEVIVNSTSKKQVSPSQKWCGTLNNYTNSEYSELSELLSMNAAAYCIGKEVGEGGTPHLQIWAKFKKAVRPTAAAGNKRIYWEKQKAKVDIMAYGYCWKGNFEKAWTKEPALDFDGNYHNCPVEKGAVKIKIIENLYSWQSKIEKLCLQEPDDRTVRWYWEDEGNIGKTQFIKYMVVKHKALFCTGGKYTDIMNLVFNQDMDNCRIVLFDIPRCNSGCVSYSSLESIKNGMVCNTKYETGVKLFNTVHVIVMANFPPDDEEKLSRDRWKIEELGIKDKEWDIPCEWL